MFNKECWNIKDKLLKNLTSDKKNYGNIQQKWQKAIARGGASGYNDSKR